MALTAGSSIIAMPFPGDGPHPTDPISRELLDAARRRRVAQRRHQVPRDAVTAFVTATLGAAP
jgi:hypothetical protein